jgi:hypothetical protein
VTSELIDGPEARAKKRLESLAHLEDHSEHGAQSDGDAS